MSGGHYAPWRGAFYPKGLRRKDELAFAVKGPRQAHLPSRVGSTNWWARVHSIACCRNGSMANRVSKTRDIRRKARFALVTG